jgi:outer membrane lipoprotein-sorting protein
MRRFVFGAAILMAGILTAQSQPDIAEILANVSSTYSSAKEYRFSVTKSGEESGSIRIAVRKPDKFRFEADGRVVDGADAFRNLTVVGEGSTVWIYRSELRQYTKKNVTPALLDTEPPEVTPETFVLQAGVVFLTRYVQLAKAVDRARLLRKETIQVGDGEVECDVLEIQAPLPGYRDTYTWWVDEKRHLVLREDIKPATPRRPLSSTIYTMAQIGEQIPDELFHFSPPPGAKFADEPER